MSKNKEYRIKNWEKIIVREREWNKNYYYRIRNRIYELLGNKCCRCGIEDNRVFQVDHIKGGGNSRKIINRSGQGRMNKLLKVIEAGSKDYQLLCANCNVIKKHENGEIVGHIRKSFYGQNIKELSQIKTIRKELP